MSNTFKVSETLRQMGLRDRKLSWLGGIAETVARLEEDNARKARDIEAYKGAGERYEQKIARKDDAIAEQARQLKEALAQVERERNALPIVEQTEADREYIDYICPKCRITLQQHFKASREPMRYSQNYCHHCGQKLSWRGPCAENGGVKR